MKINILCEVINSQIAPIGVNFVEKKRIRQSVNTIPY